MIVVDTTVLVYAVGADHPLRNPCRRLVELVGEGRLRATTTVEVLQEFVHVRSRRRDRADAAALARDFAGLLSPLLQPGADDLADGLDLYTRHGELGPFDAVLAATARAGGAAALVSADRSFAVLGRRLRHLDPAAPGFVDALEALGS